MTHGEVVPSDAEATTGEVSIGADESTWQALAPRAILRWRLNILGGGVVAFGVMLLVLQPFVLDEALTWRTQFTVATGVAVVGLGAAVIWPALQFRHWRYRLADDALELERGVLVRRRSVIPYPRVQQIDLNRSLIDRMLGLSVAKLLTASSGTDAKVPGLTPEAAETFRHTVLSRTGRHDAV